MASLDGRMMGVGGGEGRLYKYPLPSLFLEEAGQSRTPAAAADWPARGRQAGQYWTGDHRWRRGIRPGSRRSSGSGSSRAGSVPAPARARGISACHQFWREVNDNFGEKSRIIFGGKVR